MRSAIELFIKEQAIDADLFCFQEVYEEMEALCDALLPGYQKSIAYKNIGELDGFAQATYVRKNAKVVAFEPVLKNTDGTGLGICAEIETAHGRITIVNFHGTARPGNKLDTPRRISQSEGLIDFFKNKEGLKIVGGDFNLSPETKSVALIEEGGFKNLIKEFNIRTTRNQLSWGMYPQDPQYYADYAFVSPEVKIKKFSVPENEVSDHLPLILEIEE